MLSLPLSRPFERARVGAAYAIGAKQTQSRAATTRTTMSMDLGIVRANDG